MDKGLSKSWTPQSEKHFERLLATCRTFAARDLVMSLRDILKYDLRTKESKRAVAQARLRLASATDNDLRQMAELELAIAGEDSFETVPEKVEELKKMRAKIREKGIRKSDLECRQDSR